MRTRPLLIGYLGLTTTQENIDLPDILAILSPIDEPIHTLDMQYHCMNITPNTINTLNFDQILVDTGDQLIFVLKNDLMIRFPDKFGLNK